MRNRIACASICCFLFIACAHGADVFALRSWTSQSGTTVEAELVEVKNGNVVLKANDGKLLQVPYSGLSDPDKAFIKSNFEQVKKAMESAKEAPPKGVIPAKGENRLPVLADSKWSRPSDLRNGMVPDDPIVESFAHTIYKGANYTAYLDDQAKLFIVPKVMPGGSEHAFNGAIRLVVPLIYFDAAEEKHMLRKIIKYVDPPAPSKDPNSVSIKALLEYDAVWEMKIDFSSKSIIVESSVSDPPNLKPGTQSGVTFRFPASHVISPEMKLPEVQRMVSDCSLAFKGNQKQGKHEEYAKSMNLWSMFYEAEIVNHWHGRTITVDVIEKKGRHKQAKVSNYSGMPLYCGFNIDTANNATRLFQKKEDDPIDPAVLKITID